MTVLLLAAPVSPALAEVVAVVDRATVPAESVAGDVPYLLTTARVHGVVANDDAPAAYDVPVRVLHPADAGDCAGTATVEPRHQTPGRDVGALAEQHPSRHGWVQVASGWDPLPDARGAAGRLERGGDAYAVMADMAGLARAPGTHLPGVCPADRVIGFGYSRTAFLLRGAAIGGRADALDGIVLADAGARCLDLTAAVRRITVCPGPPAPGPPVASVNSEYAVERFLGALARADGPNYRVYEVAGTPHVPMELRNVFDLGGLRQNPARSGPVIAAMLRNVDAFARTGLPLPASRHLEGALAPWGSFPPLMGCADCEWFAPARDADGNALGGVRLPHIAVPVGAYGGVETDFEGVAPDRPTRVLVSYGGTFVPFAVERVRAEHPTRGAYVSAVAAAARALARDRLVVEDAGGRFASDAARQYPG